MDSGHNPTKVEQCTNCAMPSLEMIHQAKYLLILEKTSCHLGPTHLHNVNFKANLRLAMSQMCWYRAGLSHHDHCWGDWNFQSIRDFASCHLPTSKPHLVHWQHMFTANVFSGQVFWYHSDRMYQKKKVIWDCVVHLTCSLPIFPSHGVSIVEEGSVVTGWLTCSPDRPPYYR